MTLREHTGRTVEFRLLERNTNIDFAEDWLNEVKDQYANEYGICIYDTNEWLLVSSEGTITGRTLLAG